MVVNDAPGLGRAGWRIKHTPVIARALLLQIVLVVVCDTICWPCQALRRDGMDIVSG